jgi:hypothetical protein
MHFSFGSTQNLLNILTYFVHPRIYRVSYATSRKVAGSIPGEFIRFFNLPNLSSRTRNLLGGKGRPARKADNLTAISESTV